MSLPSLDPNRLATIAAATRHAVDCALDRTERTNAHRVREADALVTFFHGMTGVNPDPDADGPETALGDMLAHLMHWAEANGVDFEQCFDSGKMHFTAEALEEETARIAARRNAENARREARNMRND